MSNFTDETLMAFADGELDAATRAQIEQAMQADPAIAAQVAQHRALRADVFGAFADVLDEPVPQRLHKALAPSQVIELDAVRAARKQAASGNVPGPAVAGRRWSWPEWGALAATLMLGVLVGKMDLTSSTGAAQLATLTGNSGALTAQGPLVQALSGQLAGTAKADDPVQIGVSFVSKEGKYCRSFIAGSSAGLACKSGSAWTVPVLAEAAPAMSGDYRQAGSAMPAAVLDAIDERIAGAALDAPAERRAQQQGWQFE
jgi:hypothetical protein